MAGFLADQPQAPLPRREDAAGRDWFADMLRIAQLEQALAEAVDFWGDDIADQRLISGGDAVDWLIPFVIRAAKVLGREQDAELRKLG